MDDSKLEKKIFFNGTVVTINDKQPIVEAIGIVGEKIKTFGSLEDVKKVIGDNYNLIDLDGKTLLPGFIDSHLHPILFLFFLLNLNLSDVKNLKELQNLLKKASKDKKDPNKLIVGLSLKEENFENPILPTRWDLDEACPQNPVFLLRYDGHIGILNSKALELAGIDSNTMVEGGEISKNEKGELTGIITENAIALILSKVSLPSAKEIEDTASKAFKMLAKKGITSVHGITSMDRGGEFGDLGAVEIPILRSIQDKVLQNWYSLVFTEKPKKLKRIQKPPLDEGKINGKFKVNCLKMFADGTLGAATACMDEPFTDHPDKCGFLVVDENEIYNRMKIAHNLGFQIGIHVIGDKGNRIVVNLFKKLLTEYPREDHRHRLEHASLLKKDVINDIKELGLICSCQPPFINSEYYYLEKRLGKERCKYTYPFNSIINAGIVLASGSDCPVEDPDVIMGLHALVTRNGFVPEECISIENALKSYTINGAYAAFEENIKGSIEIGKLADFVILDKNPLETPKEEIKKIKVVETIIRGKTVYKR